MENNQVSQYLRDAEDLKNKAKIELFDKMKVVIEEADAYLSEEKLFKNTIKKDDLYHAKIKQFLEICRDAGF